MGRLDDRSPSREGVGRRPRGGGDDQAVSSVRGEGLSVDADAQPHGVAHRRLLEHRLVEGRRCDASALEAVAASTGRRRSSIRSSTSYEPARNRLSAMRSAGRLDLGEVAELAHVDPDDRHASAATRSTVRSMVPSPPRLTATSRPRAKSASALPTSVSPAMPASCSGRRTSCPRSRQPRRGVTRQLGRLVALVVDDDPDDGHGGTTPSRLAAPGSVHQRQRLVHRGRHLAVGAVRRRRSRRVHARGTRRCRRRR